MSFQRKTLPIALFERFNGHQFRFPLIFFVCVLQFAPFLSLFDVPFVHFYVINIPKVKTLHTQKIFLLCIFE